MRYTPFLDEKKITLKVPEGISEEGLRIFDNLANILDSCLAVIERNIDWGEFAGKKRKPCLEQPMLLAGAPLGQYHCPVCGMMLLAGLPHFSPSAVRDGIHTPGHSIDDYEAEYGRAWPAGYEEDDVGS